MKCWLNAAAAVRAQQRPSSLDKRGRQGGRRDEGMEEVGEDERGQQGVGGLK